MNLESKKKRSVAKFSSAHNRFQTPDAGRQTLPLVIVNPSSAGGATGDAWPRAASELRRHFGAFSCAFTNGTGDARLIAAREARAGRRLIIACGGDGTINEVANGILESGADAELGVLPSGTGGDFRRTLQMPTRVADAAIALRTGRTFDMDIGRVAYVNHEGARQTRYFLNVASFGMGGEVVARVKEDELNWLPVNASRLFKGKVAFASAALRTTLSFEKPTVRVQLDDKRERRLVIANLCVANARYFGGGMKIAPDAKLNDGLFDVIVIGDLSAPAILSHAHRLYLGTHLDIEQVQQARASRLTAQAADEDEKISLEIDGELPGSLPATFEIVPRALCVRVPR